LHDLEKERRRMTPEQLNYFLVIEKHMNFSAAAEELNIPSSLSRQIRNLEDEIGVTLFKRTTRKIELTEAGADFSLHARRILGTYQNMYAKMKEHSAGRNKIVLASVPVISIYRLTEMIASFNELWPM
jgi:DNA-binding transcriptional LysR family regulator